MFFEETEILRFSKKSPFPKTDYKNRNFRKLTTDLENRTKRPVETKACVFLDVDH